MLHASVARRFSTDYNTMFEENCSIKVTSYVFYIYGWVWVRDVYCRHCVREYTAVVIFYHTAAVNATNIERKRKKCFK